MRKHEYSPLELRQMDDEEARETLTVDQYERREKLIELHEQAEETKERWEQQAEQVTDLTVHADPNQLGVEVDLYGNEVLVHIDSDNRHFRQAAAQLDDTLGDADSEEIDELGEERRDMIADNLQTMLDEALLEWNGHDWHDLDTNERETVLAQCRDKWGVDGMLDGWLDIAAAIYETREERVETVESFRRPAGRGDN